MNPEELSTLVEQTEAEFWHAYETAGSDAVKAKLGIASERVAGGIAISMLNDPTGGFWCKALGFPADTQLTSELVGDVLDFYRRQGTPSASVQPAPSILPDDWATIAAEHGLTPGGTIVKLTCAVDDLIETPAKTDLRVGPVGPDEATEFATATLLGFGMPDALADMVAATVEHPAFRPFAAWDGDQIVAAGTLFVHGTVGSVNAGATVASHRNRGAQSAIIAARIAAARELGCTRLIAESGQPAPGTTNPSLDNLIRAGLKPLYSRQNWNWTA
ncbi:GNAT family N-acetyltransferase [Kribbella sp. NPDC055071]